VIDPAGAVSVREHHHADHFAHGRIFGDGDATARDESLRHPPSHAFIGMVQ
jgi:hypothetical protein